MEAPPPPPEEVVMRVYMHCEGCAKKVKRCLKGFEGRLYILTLIKKIVSFCMHFCPKNRSNGGDGACVEYGYLPQIFLRSQGKMWCL